MARELPPLVEKFLRRAVPGGPPYPRHVHTRQEGEMCLKPGGQWKPFTAEQDFDAEHTYFEWRANMPIAGPLSMKAVDRMEDGHGRLTARLLGLPVVSADGPDNDVGELMRYLAELPWNPGAIALNAGLAWTQIDDHSVEVSCTEGAASATVTLIFSPEGDVEAIRALRPKDEGEPPVLWGGDYGDYADVNGLHIPRMAEVWWDLPGGRHRYFRGRITSLQTET